MTLEASDDFFVGRAFFGASLHVVAGARVPTQAAEHDPERAALVCRSPLGLSRCRVVLAGIGATPQSRANAASEASRLWFSPVLTSSCPAVSAATPLAAGSRVDRGAERLEQVVEVGDLGRQLLVAGPAAQGKLEGGDRGRGAGSFRAQVRAGGGQLFDAQPAQPGTKLVGGGDDQGSHLGAGCRRAVRQRCAGPRAECVALRRDRHAGWECRRSPARAVRAARMASMGSTCPGSGGSCGPEDRPRVGVRLNRRAAYG